MSNTNQAVKKSTHDQHDHKPALHHISTRQKVIVMLAVMSAMFLVSLDQTIIAAALGKIVEDFQSFGSLSWVVTAYMLTMTVTVPLAGKLSDMFGRKKLLISGVAIFTIASLLSQCFHYYWRFVYTSRTWSLAGPDRGGLCIVIGGWSATRRLLYRCAYYFWHDDRLALEFLDQHSNRYRFIYLDLGILSSY